MTLRRLGRTLLMLGGTIAVLTLAAFGLLVGAAWFYSSPASRHELEQAHVDAVSTAPHRVHLLDTGAESLDRRLALIAGAKESIELEFFIYNVDEASRLVTQALMAKAAEGVKVRLLVDFSAPVFQLKPIYARFLKAQGVEVRYYNTAPFYQLFSIQHRSHRKLLIVDGRTVLTGGRNIADDYFDLSSRYNFLDSDIEIEGPIVQPVRSSFDLYWNSPLAVVPDGMDSALDASDLARAHKAFLPAAGDADRARAARSGAAVPAFSCNDIRFATDFPEKGEGNRRVFAMLSELGAAARNEVWIESPYFVIKEDGYALMERIQKNGARIRVLTNSLYSTDAFYTVAALYANLDWIARSGIELYSYNGDPPAALPAAAPSRGARWGIHSKRAAIDGHTVVVGTYNIDPRSANLNSELVIVCKGQPEFAAALRASILERARQAERVMAEGIVVNEAALFGRAGAGQKLLFYVSMPFAWLFDFLL